MFRKFIASRQSAKQKKKEGKRAVYSNPVGEDVNKQPQNVWSLIVSYLSLDQGYHFALSNKAFSVFWSKYLTTTQDGCRRLLIAQSIIPEAVFDGAHESGITVDYVNIYTLYTFNQKTIRNLYTLQENEYWAIAALSGDQQWITQHINPKKIPFLKASRSLSLIDLLSFAGFYSDMMAFCESGHLSEADLRKRRIAVLSYASLGGHRRCIQLLTEKLDKRGELDDTVLDSLMKGGHLELALELFPERIHKTHSPKLLEQQFFAKNTTEGGESVLRNHIFWSMTAAENGHFHVFDYFHDNHGLSEDIRENTTGNTLVHYAAQHNDVKRVEDLLQRVFHEKPPTNNAGEYPVHFAARGGAKSSLLKQMKYHSHYASEQTLDDLNPLKIVTQNRHTRLVKTLRDKCSFKADTTERGNMNLLFQCAVNGDWDGFCYLHDELGVPVVLNGENQSVASLALMCCQFRFVDKFIERFNYDLAEERDTTGNPVTTLLMIYNSIEILDYGIERYGLSMTHKNKYNRCPLSEYAAEVTREEDDDICRFGWIFLAKALKRYTPELPQNWYEERDNVRLCFQSRAYTAKHWPKDAFFPQTDLKL